jgi:hypothetical protein
MFLLLFCFLLSCKTEKTIPPVDKKAIIDSTITAFQKTLLEQQIDSVFKKYHFNGSIAVLKILFLFTERKTDIQTLREKLKLTAIPFLQ